MFGGHQPVPKRDAVDWLTTELADPKPEKPNNMFQENDIVPNQR